MNRVYNDAEDYDENYDGKRYKPITVMSQNNQKKRPNKLVVTKTIQTVKSTVKNKSSEERENKLLNLEAALRNRNTKATIKMTQETIETENDEDGDNRSMWRDTWEECLNLYQSAKQGKAIKSDDKDNYLPEKLFGNHFFKFDYSSRYIFYFYKFFTQRMIASTLLKVSKKQTLSKSAIEKLAICIDSLTNLIKAHLHFKDLRDMYDQFNQTVILDYLNIEHFREPEMFKNLADKMISKIMVQKTNWIGQTYKKKNKNLCYEDIKEVQTLIRKELEQLRMDAVNALYNSALRDSKILSKGILEKIEIFLNDNKDDYDSDFDRNDTERFKNVLFKMLTLVESKGDLDYEALFKTYFKIIKEPQTFSLQNQESAVNFLYNQSKDRQRCEKLFTDSVLEDLIELLTNRNALNQDIKILVDLVEIVNNYLGHDFSAGLSEKQLCILIDHLATICIMDSTRELIDAAFLAILLTVEKARTRTHDIWHSKYLSVFGIPSTIRINFLITNTILLESYANNVILILSRVKTQQSLEIKELETLSQHLENEYVVVDDDGNSIFKFEKLSNSQYSSVSMLACRLILSSIEHANGLCDVSSDTIDNLLLSIERSADKQTKIIAAKCVYKLANVRSFDKDHLNLLKNNLSHEVHDIDVYLHAAYVKCLMRLARDNTSLPIEVHHLESLSSLHIKESLKIGDLDFTNEINANILELLKHEAKKQKLNDENLFTLFDDILYTSESHASEVLEILETYTLKRYAIPDSTVTALENTLISRKDLFDETLFILQCVIHNGQSVSGSTLHIFTDNLYNSTNSRRRFRAFKSLEQARRNQDIASDVFFKLELEKCAFGLCRVANTKPLLEFVKAQTDKGFSLPIDTMTALGRHLDDENVLEIRLDITRSKQMLSYDLLSKLAVRFNLASTSTKTNQLLLSLFANVSQNNQRLSHELLVKLESALDHGLMEDKALSLFVHRAQRGEQVTRNVVEKLLKRIESEGSLVTRQEYISSLAALILNNSDLLVDSVKADIVRILSENVKSENAHIQNICINGWRSLLNKFQVDTKYLSQLIQISTNPKCDEAVKQNLMRLFDSLSSTQNCLTASLRASIELDNLEYKSSEELLDKLGVYMKNGNYLLMRNYAQLANVIDEGSPNLKHKALNLLSSYSHTDEMSGDLIESIAFLYDSSTSAQKKTMCINILNKIQEKLDQHQEKVANRVSAIFQQETRQAYYAKNYANSNIYNLFKNQFQLDNVKICELLRLLNMETNLLDMKDLNTFLSYCLTNCPDYYKNSSFVFLIEQVLLSGEHSVEALICYNRIIEEKRYQNLEGVLEKLIQIKNLSNRRATDVELLGLVIKCISSSVDLVNEVPIDCLKLLESHIEHTNEFIRSCSFKGLFAAYTKYNHTSATYTYNSDAFRSWCDKKLEALSKLVDKDLRPTAIYLDYLELVSSLSSIDLDVFKSQPREVWKRELLVSSLFTRLQPNHAEKISFYTTWFEIENKFEYIPSIKVLRHLHDRVSIFQSMNELNDTVSIIKELDLNTVVDRLRRDLDPFMSLRIEWGISHIMRILRNKEEISISYIESLAERMLLLLDLKLAQQIFQSVVAIDNLKAFEALVDFCYVENVKVDDVCFENVESVRDLQSLIQVKHICNHVQSSAESTNWNLFNLMFSLIKKNWTYDQLLKLIDTCQLNLARSEQVVIDAFKVIDYFKLSSMKYELCLETIRHSKHATDLLQNLNQLAVENSFQEKGRIKDGAQLLSELEVLNSSNQRLLDYVRTDLPKQLKTVKSALLKSSVLAHDKPICEWSEKYIGKWADEIASQNRDEIGEYLAEGVAVVKRANFIFTGYELTDTQILCSLISLNSYSGSELCGRKLLQVATGEGKSTIVCILAILNALTTKGGQVNVITSSSVLADRDAKDKAKLFKMFNLKCACNDDATAYLKGKVLIFSI